MIGPEQVHAHRFFAAGDHLIRAGEKPVAAYLIQSGRVRIYESKNGQEHDIAVLGAGQIVGEMALLSHQPASRFNVAALEATSIVIIAPDTLEEKLRRSDPTIRAIVSMLLERLYSADQALAAVGVAAVPRREAGPAQD